MKFFRHKTGMRASSRSGLPRRILLISILLGGALTAGSYVHFVPRLSGDVVSSCSIPTQSLAAPQETPSCPVPAESDERRTPPQAEGSVEIVDVTGQDDTLYSLLVSNLAEDAPVADICSSLSSVIQANLDSPFDGDTLLKPGSRYSIILDRDNNLLKATIELDPALVFHVVLQDSGYRAWKEEVVLDFKPETICLTVQHNVIESVLKAGEGMELALKLTNVFRYDIDFQSEALSGDVCKILFERRYADDRPSGYGQILCALYEGKKTGRKTAVLFNGTYYDGNGVELKKNFLRSPLNVLRVTSRYGKRFHPILKVWRKHDGVDYGAPTGTQVWAVAGGVVTSAGWKGGFGNQVCIRHDNGYESRYGHLSRSFVCKGQRIKQRQRIGLVGQTGQATGPHLDFQLLANNRHLDPLKVKMVKTLRTVPSPLKTRFASVAEQRFSSLGMGPVSQRPAQSALATLQ